MKSPTIFSFVLFFFSVSFFTPILAQNLTKLSYEELDSLKYLYMDNGDFGAAIPIAQAARDKALAEFGKQDSTFVVHTESLGHLYGLVHEFDKAEPLLKQAIELGKKVLGEEHKDYANFLYNLAQLYQDMGKYELAETFYLQDIKIAKKILGEQHPDYAISISNLALLYYDMGQFEQCEALNLQAIAIRKKTLGDHHIDYATSLNNLASAYYQMGKYEEVELLFLQVKEIFGQILGKQHQHYGSTLNNLAFLYMNKQEYKKAEPLFLECLDVFKQIIGEKHPHYGKLLNNLAMLYYYMNQDKEAERLYLKVNALRKEVLGEAHPDYAESLNNLAQLYEKMGKYPQAAKLYVQSSEITKNALGKHNYIYLSTLNSMASFDARMGDFEKAKSHLFEAIRNNCKSDIDSIQIQHNLLELSNQEFYANPQIIESLDKIYHLAIAQYNKQPNPDSKLLEYAYTALQVTMQINEKVRNGLNGEKDKLRTLHEMSNIVYDAIALGIKLEDKNSKKYLFNSFEFAEQNKSILLADVVKGQRAKVLSDLPDSLVVYETKLQQEKKDLQKQEAEAADNQVVFEIRKKQNKLNLEIGKFLKLLKEKYPQYHALKYANITAKVEDVQALLDEKTLVLEYFVADTITYLFAVSKSNVELFLLQIKKEALQLAVGDLRKALSDYKYIVEKSEDAHDLFNRKAFFLYQQLLQSALTHPSWKGKIKNLNIITDGELGHLPFEVFLVKAASQKEKEYKNLHYLVNDYSISYNYSATLWKESLKTHSKGGNSQILACGASYAPIDSADLYSFRDWYSAKIRKELMPLPAVSEEIKTLSNQFKGSFLEGTAANEADFKKNAHQYSVIHLAMHGILHPNTPILSSLAFTENRDSTEDNFLQAYEIAHLHLNADLVVLSACETGYGKFEQGEGVISLARSFMYAGVPSLVVSLWQVNDHSTAIIMTSFYENLSNGMPKDEALRQAKLDYIQRADGVAAHPAFWSPFIQLGDNRPVVVGTRGVSKIWWISGGGLLLLGGVFAMRRKSI